MTGPTAAKLGSADPAAAQVAQVRAFNRFYTNVIGVLHGMYLDSPYTLTESRVLLVEPWARGLGLGARLVGECLRFARDAGYADIVLWTYDRLAAARRIYQAASFTLAAEQPEDAFGHRMLSQTRTRPL